MDDESVVNEYASSLSELTTNSKPLISMLTILADENKTHAAKIAQVIQNYLEKSPSKIKLLALYLIDSIVKNVREPYIQLFSENLVPMFTEVFEGGDEKVRTALFKLKQTWKGIFSESKLYLVDISTKRMDPQWPITTSSENVRAPIHLNPKFFLRQTNGTQETKASQMTDTGENIEAEKSSHSKSQIEPDQPHKSDGERINILKVNTAAEKRADPRLRKKETNDRKHSSKSSSRHDESSDKSRSTSKSSSRSSSQKSDYKKRDNSKRASERLSPLEPSLADKEAAAILSGDVDLRLLGPQTKKRKDEPSAMQELASADVDLRIRPTNIGEESATNPVIKSESLSVAEPVAQVNDDDEDIDKAAQWAKVKGTSLSYSTEPASLKATAAKDIRAPLARATHGQPAAVPMQTDVSSIFLSSERNIKPSVLQDIGTSSGQKGKTAVRISDPAPDSGQIRLDGRMREVRFVDGVAIAILDEMPPNFVRARQIMFRGGTKKIIINDNIEVLAAFDGREHEFNLNGNRHRVRFGAPLRELYIDGIPYACEFNGSPIYVRSREDVFSVTLHPPCPSVNDKMEATSELLNKLGLKPLLLNPTAPFVGGPFHGMHPLPGHIVLNGANSGGWIRYQEEIRAPTNLPPPGIFPPIPTNLGPLPPHPGFPRSSMFCPPSHLGGPPYGAYPGPPPLLPPANIAPIPTTGPAASPGVAVTSQTVPELNVSDLLSKLVNAGMIGTGDKSDPSVAAEGGKGKELTKEEIPKLSFKQSDALKKRYNGVISALHDGMQCATCGQRFTQAEKNSDKYAQHLDWHFRSARREREGLKKASSRKWFYDISDWMLFEEVEDVDDRARSYFEIQEAQLDNPSLESETPDVQEVPSVSAKSVDQNENTCFLCHEAFELFFCEETEEWRLRNAVTFEGKVFHPNCSEDFIRPPCELIVPKEEPPEPVEDVVMKSEPISPEADDGADEERTPPLPGLDFAPPTPKEVQKENEKVQEVEGSSTEVASAEQEESMEVTESVEDANETLQAAEQTVIVEDLGEFGVHNDSDPLDDSDDSTQNSEATDIAGVSNVKSPDNVSQDSQMDSKIIVKSSGGIVLKVNHDSKANGDAKLMDTSVAYADEPEPRVEWRPPTPDPAYKSFALVKKGTEESGLCSLM